MNMFFPDPNATLFERKKSNLERQQQLPEGIASHQSISGSRGSSKHIEPHRIVKVSKPFSGNTFVSKNTHVVKVSQRSGHKTGSFNPQ